MDTETKNLMEQVRQQLTEGNKVKSAVEQVEQQMRELPRTIDNKIAAVRRVSWDGLGNYRGVMGSEAEARGFGLYVMGTVGGSGEARAALRSEFKDMHERAIGDDPAGSPLVPVEYSGRIQRLVEDFGVWARNAFPMPMSSDKLTFQRRSKGLKVFKTGANQAATESEPAWKTINLNADEWNTLTLYPKSLGEDAAAAIGEMLALEIAQAFAEQLDDSGFAGDGTPASLDVMGIAPRLVEINGAADNGAGMVLGAGAAGDGWGGLVQDDFLKMKGRARYVRDNGKWYCSSEFFWTVVAPIILNAGGVTAAEVQGQRRLQFLGSDVELTPSMPRLAGNSQVPALYGDLRLSSTHGRRRELTVEQSTDAKFIERQVAVLGTQRHAVSNHTLGDDTTPGPMVGLLTPAAA